MADRARRLLAPLWAGWMLCTALLATPAPFALLARADAGRVVGRMLAGDAYVALGVGVVLLLLERRAGGPRFTVGVGLALGTLFCTVAGYFAVLPLMDAARAGRGAVTFGQLHAASAGFFVVKLLLVLALAWRAVRPSS